MTQAVIGAAAGRVTGGGGQPKVSILQGRGVVGPMMVATGMVLLNEWLVGAGGLFTDEQRQITFNARLARPLVGFAIATGGLLLLSQFMPRTAVLLSWTAVAGTALVRVDPKTPSPMESLLSWYNSSPSASPFTTDPRAMSAAKVQQK